MGKAQSVKLIGDNEGFGIILFFCFKIMIKRAESRERKERKKRKGEK